jgi:hypothetical protein
MTHVGSAPSAAGFPAKTDVSWRNQVVRAHLKQTGFLLPGKSPSLGYIQANLEFHWGSDHVA